MVVRNGQRLPWGMRPLWAAVVFLSMGLVGVLLIGCRQDDRPSSAPSLAPSASPMASGPTADTTTARPTGVAVGTAVRTVVGDLEARSAAGLGASSTKIEPPMPKGTRLFVIAGAVVADGLEWYQVLSFDGVYPGVWVASASQDGAPWLESDARPCPSPPLDATALLDLKPYGGLACYGGKEIQLVGDVRCELGDVDRAYAGPDWLRADRFCELDLGGNGETMEIFDGGIVGLSLPATRRALISGHFDDQQASSCVYALEPPAPDPVSVVANCQAMFVATALDPAP